MCICPSCTFSPAKCHIITTLQSVASCLVQPKFKINRKPLYYQTLINLAKRWTECSFLLFCILLSMIVFLKHESIHKLETKVFFIFGFVYLSLSIKSSTVLWVMLQATSCKLLIHVLKYGHYFSDVWQSYIERNLDHLLTVCLQWVTLQLLISGPMLKKKSCSFISQSCSTLLNSNCSVSPHTSPECHTHIHHSYVRHVLLERDKHLFGSVEKDIFIIGDGDFLVTLS